MSLPNSDMEEQLRALNERVQQLQAENDRLKATEGVNVGASTSNGEETQASMRAEVSQNRFERYIYIPRERKCPRFSGKSADMPSVEDWVEEVRRSLEGRHMSPREQALFIYDHLDGEAKTEIKFRPASERNDPEKILTILVDIYGCSKSYIGLQKQFFHRRQLEGESLREYSHSLLSLMEIIKRQSPRPIANGDHLVRDQFIEYVRDSMLRRELKRTVRLNPNVPFLTIRSDAIRWVEEGEHGGLARTRAYSCDTQLEVVGEYRAASQAVTAQPSNELAELKECLKKQQAQLDMLLTHLSLGNKSPSTQGASLGQTAPSYPYDSFGRPICVRCKQPGHIARFCREGRGSNPVSRGGRFPDSGGSRSAGIPFKPQEN
ncbi:uncharacterized protein LOC119265439 [Pygocentrus nattereri]|uniref:uncharacterized protein LOC119265439 n=1 Tax=Pygocentrus nattereri TaxID=42514 RepID=UPI001890E0E5|nr:uncharacterized protein LOC119265439 [Pygocentrus nattereri]XP_037402126.1 uncharacterized protein LOC119265439 [Pygocentrus nattereri]XP_037402127.1 uncharacterized protein LOC119265439 [Pygocentrus nattereri]